jgi:hypothetical protein
MLPLTTLPSACLPDVIPPDATKKLPIAPLAMLPDTTAALPINPEVTLPDVSPLNPDARLVRVIVPLPIAPL